MDHLRGQLALALLGYAIQRDMDASKLCELAGIRFESITQQQMDISEEQLEQLWFHAVQVSGDELFGLHFGEGSQLAALGVISEIVRSSATVGEAIMQSSAMTGLLTQRIQMLAELGEQHIQVRIMANPSAKAKKQMITRQLQDFFAAFFVHELDGLLLCKVVPEKAWVNAVEPHQRTEYERVLRCAVKTNANYYCVQLPRALWHQQLLITNYEPHRHFLEASILPLGGAADPSYSSRVKRFLLQHAYLGLPSVEDVARNFHLTPRTLQRYLKKEGTSFSMLQAEAAKKIAVDLLKKSGRSVSEVGYLLGYREPSAFIRAFRRWTGTTPSALAG
jgi:AraC-like DNA-binding protein